MKKIFLSLLGGIVFPFTALAQVPPGAPNSVGAPIQDPNTVILYIQTIGNWIFSLLLAIAVIYILLAAYNYLTGSTGEGVSKAHKMLLWAAVAITVAIFSKGIVYVVAKLAGGSIKSGSI